MPQRNRVLAPKQIGWLSPPWASRRGHPVIAGCPFSFSRWRHELSTNDREKRIRVNRMIRISPVRVITAAGEQLGVLPIEGALAAGRGGGRGGGGGAAGGRGRPPAPRWSRSWTTGSSSSRKPRRRGQQRKSSTSFSSRK